MGACLPQTPDRAEKQPEARCAPQEERSIRSFLQQRLETAPSLLLLTKWWPIHGHVYAHVVPIREADQVEALVWGRRPQARDVDAEKQVALMRQRTRWLEVSCGPDFPFQAWLHVFPRLDPVARRDCVTFLAGGVSCPQHLQAFVEYYLQDFDTELVWGALVCNVSLAFLEKHACRFREYPWVWDKIAREPGREHPQWFAKFADSHANWASKSEATLDVLMDNYPLMKEVLALHVADKCSRALGSHLPRVLVGVIESYRKEG